MSRRIRPLWSLQAACLFPASCILALTVLLTAGCTPAPAPSGVVDTQGDTGLFCSLALDPDTEYPIISYSAEIDLGNPSVQTFARWTGFAWGKTKIDDYGKYSHLVVDGSGRRHIIYFGIEDRWAEVSLIYLKHASWESALWKIQEPVTANPIYSMIYPQESAVDSSGRLHSIYVLEDWLEGTATLYYITNLEAEPDAIPIHESSDQSITEASIAINPETGLPRICFFDGSDSLVYASFEGNQWRHETVDTAEYVGWANDLALDAVGHPMISYADSTNSALKFASYDQDTWSIEIVEGGIDPGASSIAVGSGGHPCIAYHDYDTGELRLARHDAEGWHISILDSEGDVGRYCSLALDSLDRVRLVYYNATIGKLLYYAED